nr:hypothetical protein [Nonomuraea cypriaca]
MNHSARTTSSHGVRRTYRRPASTAPGRRSAAASRWNSSRRMATTAAITTKKLAALITNSPPFPVNGSSAPARLMPRMRPAELRMEPSAIALGRSAGGTTSAPNRPSAGPPSAVTTPPASATP